MKTNFVRQRLADGNPVIGSFLGLGSPNLAGLMAHAGYDWLVIETEHNGLDSAEVEHMLMAVSSTNVVPIVRVPSSSHIFIQRALDMGALGVLVPMVKTKEEAQAIVEATRFPPQGSRSWGPLRASGYTFDTDDYYNRANENIIVALIIETREAADNLEEIAAVPGVDVIFLGAWDLSLALGLDPRLLPHPETDSVLQDMIAISKRFNTAVGAGVDKPEEVQELLEKGVTFLSYGTDYNLLANASRTGIDTFKRIRPNC